MIKGRTAGLFWLALVLIVMAIFTACVLVELRHSLSSIHHPRLSPSLRVLRASVVNSVLSQTGSSYSVMGSERLGRVPVAPKVQRVPASRTSEPQRCLIAAHCGNLFFTTKPPSHQAKGCPI